MLIPIINNPSLRNFLKTTQVRLAFRLLCVGILSIQPLIVAASANTCGKTAQVLTTDIEEQFLRSYFKNGRWKTTIVLQPHGKGFYSSRMLRQLRNLTRGWIYRYGARKVPLSWGVLTDGEKVCVADVMLSTPFKERSVSAMTIVLRFADVTERRLLYRDNGKPRLGPAISEAE